jgi:CheY-like chemotaxis protein
MHGGTTEVESEGTGRGTTFIVRLPLGGSPERPAGPPKVVAAPEASALAGLRVLVVDDEEDTRDVLATMLSRKGVAVETVGSAAEALRALQRRWPDVLVCDIGMPGEDGYQLLARVRALSPEGAQALPAIALTAYARAEDRRRALASGYQEHLAKPVDPDQLAVALAAVARRGAGPGAS